jgi:hypothetical protein
MQLAPRHYVIEVRVIRNALSSCCLPFRRSVARHEVFHCLGGVAVGHGPLGEPCPGLR